jgi:3'-5' exoribonuclease 1
MVDNDAPNRNGHSTRYDCLVKELQDAGFDPLAAKQKWTVKLLERKLKAVNKRKQQHPQPAASVAAKIQYYLVLDYEATCDVDSGFDYLSEIIEFPALLVDRSTLAIVDTFHQYVKPSFRPHLTEFCTQLTGIEQSMVDNSKPFPQVFEQFLEWLQQHVESLDTVICVTDGPWDLRDFLEKECIYHCIQRPTFMRRIIDLRKVFANSYNLKLSGGNLDVMLKALDMEFEGRPHCGMDDTMNIYRVFRRIWSDGHEIPEHTSDVYKKRFRSKSFQAELAALQGSS